MQNTHRDILATVIVIVTNTILPRITTNRVNNIITAMKVLSIFYFKILNFPLDRSRNWKRNIACKRTAIFFAESDPKYLQPALQEADWFRLKTKYIYIFI